MEQKSIMIDGKEYVLKNSINNLQPAKKNFKGLEYCIVRTYSAGVFAGYYNRKIKGKEGTVYQARRLWYWKGANSLSELAIKGVAYPNDCKFAIELPEVELKEIIEVIPCTKVAQDNIALVKVWQQ